MNNVLKILGIAVLAVILIAAGVVMGWVVGDRLTWGTARQPAYYGPGGMMGGYDGDDGFPYDGGMMRRGGRGNQDGWDRQDRWDGHGGMMGGYLPDDDLAPADGETLTLDQAVEVAEAYLADFDGDALEVDEVMQFDNHFYAAIREKDTGIGAFEILIDPDTAAVHPEPGPNMIWNAGYGMMGGRRGVMGGYVGNNASSEMTVTADKARELAQAALDKGVPGATLAEDILQFYGYYTIDTLKDGEPIGMLSVNGYTGRVWLHTWHGTFVDMIEHDE